MKKTNYYSNAFGRLYAKTPKAVFAAIAYSYTSSGGDDPEHALERFLDEWRILHQNGIVHQAPPHSSTAAFFAGLPLNSPPSSPKP